MLNQPDYGLIIDGVKWDVWKTMSVTRALDRMGGDFSVTLSQKPEQGFLSSTMQAGLAVQVEIDGETVLDGYIDTVRHSYDESSAEISVRGRDKTGDLVDCAASVDGPFEFNNIKLEKAVEKILKPYGIYLEVDVDTGAPFKRLAIQPGETAYEFIERVCRYRAILPVSNGIGGLVLVNPSQIRSSGELIYGANILRGDVALDWTNRFSLYVLKGQGEGNNESTAEEISSGEGRATDDLVTRHRPTVITAESQGFNQTLKERAEWQKKVARARAHTASYTVQGWYADADVKELWKPNVTVVSTPFPSAPGVELPHWRIRPPGKV